MGEVLHLAATNDSAAEYSVQVAVSSASLSTQGLKMPEEITRPELDAKLELIEARMDTRVARIETLIERVQISADQIKEDNKETRAASRNFKYWAIGTAVATAVGLYAANVSLTHTVIAAFEAGRNFTSSTPVPQRQPEQQQPLKK